MMYTANLFKLMKVFSLTAHYLFRSCLAKNDQAIMEYKRDWSKELLRLFKMDIEVKGKPSGNFEPCILVGNHISYLDIPLLMHFCPHITFVSKKEIKYWPVIGLAAKKVNTIFVSRGSGHSRSMVKKQIAQHLLQNKQQVAIFPSGTTSLFKSAVWKRGAFDIARNNNIQLQPFRIRYYPQSHVAYIGKDNFLSHMFVLFNLPLIKVVLEFHHPVLVEDIDSDCVIWKSWCENIS